MDSAKLQRRINSQIARVRAGTVILRKQDKRDKATRQLLGSGFVFEHQSKWILITATHVLDEFEKLAEDVSEAESGNWFDLKVAGCRLGPVPVNLRYCKGYGFKTIAEHALWNLDVDESHIEIFRQLRAADIAFVVLPRRVKSELKHHGLKPFARENVRIHDQDEITGYTNANVLCFLFGTPMSSIVFGLSEEDFYVCHKHLRVSVSGLTEGSLKVFFGRMWSEAEHSGSVNGMSGGPIVAVGFRYPVILAIQSTEHFPEADIDESEPDTERQCPNEICGIEFGKVESLIRALVDELR